MPFERTLRAVEILNIFKLLKHKPKKILDFGYGDGQITNYLHSKGYNIIGLDNSKGKSLAPLIMLRKTSEFI